MTLSHAAATLSTIWTVACTAMFIATGSLVWGAVLLVAPLPMQLARMTDRESWSVFEAIRGRRDDHGVADALDHALREPLAARPDRDDAFFVPGVPRLDASPFPSDDDELHLRAPRFDPALLDRQQDEPVAQRDRSAPISTPIR